MAPVRAVLWSVAVTCAGAAMAHAQPASSEDLGVLTFPATLSPSDVVPAGAVKWYRFTIPSVVSPAYFDLTTSSTLDDVEAALYDAGGFLIAFDDDDGPADESSLTFGASCQSRPNGSGLVHDGRDGALLAAGDYYLAVAQFNAAFGASAWNATTAGTQSGDITTTISLGTAAPVSPPAATDLGALSLGAIQSHSTSLSPGMIRWYTFEVPAITSPASYLDIGTFGAVNVNTSIALYDSSGVRIAIDDDDGPSQFSSLSFGAVCDTRPNLSPGLTDGVSFNGRDGDALPAGRYYAAVSGSLTTFASCFNASSTHTRSGSVTFKVSVNSASHTPDTPPAATPLGVISSLNQGLLVSDAPLTPGQVRWYSFTVQAGALESAATYLDIHTGGSLLSGSIDGADTFMCLYSAPGVQRATDDDDGDLTTSQLSFGDTTGRGPIGNGEDRAGADGPLAPGDYYLSVMAFGAGNQSPPCSFDVVSDSELSGTVSLSLLTNIPAGPVCGTADFDNDGDTGTDLDIEAFFACLGGNCCATCQTADFDGDGDTGTDRDIEAFFRVLAQLPC